MVWAERALYFMTKNVRNFQPHQKFIYCFKLLESLLIFFINFIFTFYIFYGYDNLKVLLWVHIIVLVFTVGSVFIRCNLSFFENGGIVVENSRIVK
jgi:hypothetical protein